MPKIKGAGQPWRAEIECQPKLIPVILFREPFVKTSPKYISKDELGDLPLGEIDFKELRQADESMRFERGDYSKTAEGK